MKESPGKIFLTKTCYENMEPTDQANAVSPPPLELSQKGSRITLPSLITMTLPKADLTDVILKRRSLRKYAEKPLTLRELSYLLYMTQGVKDNVGKATIRTVPSAGARHAFETLLLINRVEGLSPGLYRYMALEHTLVRLESDASLSDALLKGCFNQTMVVSSAVTFFWMADTYRMTHRYGERGYRFLFLDAGHVMQNLYLAAEAIHSGCCAIAAYDDQAVNQALSLDGEDQWIIYIGTCGKKE